MFLNEGPVAIYFRKWWAKEPKALERNSVEIWEVACLAHPQKFVANQYPKRRIFQSSQTVKLGVISHNFDLHHQSRILI